MTTLFKIIVISLAFTITLSGCMMNEVEGIVEKSGKSIATVQVATGLKSLAETGKRKDKMRSAIAHDVITNISNQELSEQPELLTKYMESQVSIANNDKWTGWLEGSIFLLIMVFMVLGFWFYITRRYQLPKETIKKY